ncbi:glycosyltransferase family 2 protein [Telmatobacter sp. DSM 110680]|uniref:Glycosyltransferase family 2 protein n=1 Tax=Telmatobacter sp. DSM 110680 TaxID=3036704 RepID=A0AAU7DND6_9BACT
MHLNGSDDSIRRISVAMCTYNGGRYLQEQLESIALQSRLPMELVVCDDQSTDDTISILKRFQAEAPFAVKVIRNSQRLGSTQNFDQAIGLTRGDLVALCDQDDRWGSAKLERLSEALREDPFLGGVFSDANLIDGDGRKTGQQLFAKHKFTSAKQRNFVSCPTATLLKHDVVTGATLMFRASICRYSSPIPVSWVHDGWLAWMIALHARLGLIPEPLIDYRIHAGQQLGVAESKAANGRGETRRQFYKRVARQFEDLLQRVLSEGWNQNDALVGKIREKIEFLSRQSSLSPSLGVRTLQMIGQLPRYVHYARGLGSLRADFLLGREML